MAFIAQVLSDGQLPSSVGALYTVPAATVAYIKKITLFNTNASTQTVTIYKRMDGSNDRAIIRVSLAQYESIEIENQILGATQELRGVSTNATAVDYIVDGVEEA